jgi:hypothetical protein
MEEAYRISVLKMVDYLIEVRHNLYSNAVNIAMKNEFRKINRIVEVDDIYDFLIEHPDNSSVTNLKKIVDLIRAIETALDSIR